MVRRQRRPLPPGVIGWMSDVPPRAMETRGRHNAPPTRRCCLRLDGETPSARLAMRNKPLRCRPLEGRRDQKSPSVVASSYVPRGVRGSPVFPPAAGCCRGSVFPPGSPPWGSNPSGIDPKTPGGCPASCPDAHQPARGHRHVRNWARREIGLFAPAHKTLFGPAPGHFRPAAGQAERTRIPACPSAAPKASRPPFLSQASAVIALSAAGRRARSSAPSSNRTRSTHPSS